MVAAGGVTWLSCGGPRDHPPPEEPGTEIFEQISPYPTYFAEWRLDPRVRPNPPLVGTQLSIGCLMQCALMGYQNGTMLV
jgi:hypothetical protein